MNKNVMANIGPNSPYQDMPIGAKIYGGGNSACFETGDWRTMTPVYIVDKCKQCLLCFPVCPDSCIPVQANGQRGGFDYEHCKGCGICAHECPTKCITMVREEEAEQAACKP